MGVLVNRILTSAAVSAFALLDILSCSDLPTKPGIDTDDLSADASRIVASVQVQLASGSISVGQTTQATATLQDRRGNTIQRSVTWTSSNTSVATVSGTGLVTGVAAGTSQITATSQGKSGSAGITVTDSSSTPPPTTNPGTVTDLAVSAIDSIGVNLTFTQVNDGTGQPAKYDVRYAVAPISWGSATSATSGSCTTPVAGTAIGSSLTCQVLGLRPATNYQFQLVAFRGTLNQNAVYGALSNVVSATTKSSGSPPPPPPPPPGNLLFQEDFENSSISSRGWYDNTSVLLSTTEHVSGSVASAQYHWLQGATTPTTGGAQRHKFTPSSTVYISYYVKYSANWVGSGHDYHPHEFYLMSTLDGDYDGPSNGYLVAYLEQNYQNGGIPLMALQDNKSVNYSYGPLPHDLVGVTEDRSTCGCNGMIEQNMYSECFDIGGYYYSRKQLTGPVSFQPNPGPGYKNDWNFVEAYYQLNTIVNGIGQADGVMQYWFNGNLVIDRHDIVYRTGAHPTIQFSQFLIGPYIGDGSPVDQSMWVDNLRVATSRIP
jgi:hypothetical protein